MSVEELVKNSLAVKSNKKAYARKEAGQVSKEIASYLCRGTRGIRVPMSENVPVVIVDTTCSECGDRDGEAYVRDGKNFCKKCK